MSRRLSSTSILTKYQAFAKSTTTVSFNLTRENVISGGQSKVQRWIFGMITGSAPFLAILLCWMFVSLCINNLVRLYQHKRRRYRRDVPTDNMESHLSKLNV